MPGNGCIYRADVEGALIVYLSKINRLSDAAPLRVGRISLSEGAQVAAVTDEECRNLCLCTPWGYHWRPPLNQEVLVMKDAEGRRHIVGVPDTAQTQPGEIIIANENASIRVSADGSIELMGTVKINGKVWTG